MHHQCIRSKTPFQNTGTRRTQSEQEEHYRNKKNTIGTRRTISAQEEQRRKLSEQEEHEEHYRKTKNTIGTRRTGNSVGKTAVKNSRGKHPPSCLTNAFPLGNEPPPPLFVLDQILLPCQVQGIHPVLPFVPFGFFQKPRELFDADRATAVRVDQRKQKIGFFQRQHFVQAGLTHLSEPLRGVVGRVLAKPSLHFFHDAVKLLVVQQPT